MRYFILLFLCFSLQLQAQKIPKKIQKMDYTELTTKGIELFEAEAYPKALPYWIQARKIAAKETEEYIISTIDLGLCYFELEDYKNTILYLEEVLPYLNTRERKEKLPSILYIFSIAMMQPGRIQLIIMLC